ncbi:MAG: DUF2255 family protein [Saprospiraceae bacterium]|nr:DUF2255 family protein [Saprospiraceae bacterium]
MQLKLSLFNSIRKTMKSTPFPTTFLAYFEKHTLIGIIGGSTRTQFLDIWMVNVDGRIFARSWEKSERSWFTAMRDEGVGKIKFGEVVLNVKGSPFADAEFNLRIDDAYRQRYTAAESRFYVEGITRPEYSQYTMELFFDEAGPTAES